MVKLTKIYTKTGDSGTTSLVNNERINKDHILIETIGSVDEANSAIGMINSYSAILDVIQNDLFDLGADIAGSKTVKISEDHIDRLEKQIDFFNNFLPKLESFILPKGDIHNARAIVRRAERQIWKLEVVEDINIFCAQYLNRLSDFLFVLARYDSDRTKEVLWRPTIG